MLPSHKILENVDHCYYYLFVEYKNICNEAAICHFTFNFPGCLIPIMAGCALITHYKNLIFHMCILFLQHTVLEAKDTRALKYFDFFLDCLFTNRQFL